MKNISIKLLMVLGLSFLILGCERNLPYPLEDVQKGVAIDITKVVGSDLVLSEGLTTGNFKVRLRVPARQDDYSYMQEAQLICVYTPVTVDPNNPPASKMIVVKDNIQFPTETRTAEVDINMADVCQKLGITAPELGDRMDFTTQVVLKNGEVILGWTEQGGFNGRNFQNWDMGDGSRLSYRVFYMCYLPFIEANFLAGKNATIYSNISGLADGVPYVRPIVNVEIPEDLVQVGFTKDDYIGIKLDIEVLLSATRYPDANASVVFYINKMSYDLIFEEQIIAEDVEDPQYTPTYGLNHLWFVDIDADFPSSVDVVELVTGLIWNIPGVGTLGWSGIAFDFVFDGN